jgi:nucleotide-binding universal stress UspA family protein
MILMSYDGSADAQAAIERAAKLMPGAQATVLTVWEPYVDILARTGSMGLGLGMVGGYTDSETVDTATGEAALATATEGAQRATAAGLVAHPRAVSHYGGVASGILAEAATVEADAIVMGTRGLGGVKSFLLGSVSHQVVQHADRAVLVVPSPVIAQHRRDWTGEEAVTVGGSPS